MFTKKKTNSANFWLVVLGLFLVIGFVAGGVYLLDSQGVISVGGDMPAERPEADETMPDFGDGETTMPLRGDHDEAGGELSSMGLLGILKMVLQLGVVIVVVTGFQWFYGRLVNRLSRAPTG